MNSDQTLAKLKALATDLTPLQIATLVVTFLGVVGLVIGSTYYVNTPSYALLFADIDPEAASDIVTKLKTQKVEYRIDAGGRAIRVPEARVDELRLQFAAQGLPQSGRIGFEIFDKTQFGATEFLEQVNYRRALEGELARTISTIGDVSSARVHIAMAKDSLFGNREQPAKASVILKLKSTRALPASTVNGITSLVAASVEGLRPEAVVVLDTFGRPLARPAGDEDEPLGAAQMEKQQRLERDMATRVVALLEPVVGAGRVRANVAVRVRADSEEATEERWDPETPVVRSRQVSNDQGPQTLPGGIAGARANLPAPATGTGTTPATAPVAPVALAGSSRNAETTNFEISRTTRHTVRPRGDIARLSVAVILDNAQVTKKDDKGAVTTTSQPRQPAEIQKIQGLVAAAVGLDTERGDLLTVENIAFDEPSVEDVPPLGFLDRHAEEVRQVGRVGMVLLVLVTAYFLFVRPVLKRLLPASRPVVVPQAKLPAGEGVAALPAGERPKTIEEVEAEMEEELLSETQTSWRRRLPVLTKHIAANTTKDPQTTVKLLRSWLAEEHR